MRIGRWISHLFHRRPVGPAPRTSTSPAPGASAGPSTPSRPPVDTFEPGGPMKVSLGKVTGYTPAERQKLDRATTLLGDVLNSREFRDGVLSARFGGRPGYADETRSPQDIYAAIRAAKENFTAAADGELDLNLTLENFSWFQRHTVGYTTPSSDTLTTNRRFYAGFEPAELAGHLGHEWLHKLGFEHDFKATPERPSSVPYAVGELIERLAKGPLTPLA